MTAARCSAVNRLARQAVRIGGALAAIGTVHAAINARLLRRPVPDPQPHTHRVSLLVPARNEATRIGACLTALRAVRGELEIMLLDDESSDGTREMVRAAAQADRRVRLLEGEPLTVGWLGKPHACAQLAAHADPVSDVLVFLDADVVLEADAVAAAIDLLDRHALDFVSPYPKQVSIGPAERLVQPLLQWSWLTFLPLRAAESASRTSTAVANGQFLVVRRTAYQSAGGHAAVRSEVLDDIALARALHRAGARGGVVDGTHLATCRMYRGWTEVRDGYTKSLWDAWGSPAGALAAMSVLNLAYVVPALAAVLRRSRAGLVGYAAGVAGRAITARATGGRVWPDSLANPASVAVLTLLTARSVFQARHGTLLWKGRAVVGPRL